MCSEIRGSNRRSLDRDLQPGEKILSSCSNLQAYIVCTERMGKSEKNGVMGAFNY